MAVHLARDGKIDPNCVLRMPLTLEEELLDNPLKVDDWDRDPRPLYVGNTIPPKESNPNAATYTVCGSRVIKTIRTADLYAPHRDIDIANV